MKTYILKLERHDDIVSIKDKLGWAKNSRVLIVWPESGQPLNRKLDLVLLQRASKVVGAPIALVSRDAEVRYQAPRLGIPVYPSIKKAQGETRWRLPYRFRKFATTKAREINPQPLGDLQLLQELHPQQPVPPQQPLARLGIFSIGVLSLLAVAAVLAPTAQVTLTPRHMIQDVLIDAYTNPSIQSTDIAGAVRSELIQVEVEGRDSLKTSGTIHLPYTQAEGTVRFTNLTDQKVEILKGTIVQPLGEGAPLYTTIQDVFVPAGPGESVDAKIECATPGEAGNLEAGQIIAIAGLPGTQVSVDNPEPITGGMDRTEPAPSLADRRKLHENLTKALEANALEEIKSQLESDDLLITSSLEVVRVLEETYQPEEGNPSDLLSLVLRLRIQARVLRQQELEKIATEVFDANLPSGYLALPESLRLEVVKAPELDQSGNIVWKLHAVRTVQAHIVESAAVRLVLGLKQAQAIARLENSLQLEAPPKITLMPRWWPRLPALPFRIQVLIHNDYLSQSHEQPPL